MKYKNTGNVIDYVLKDVGGYYGLKSDVSVRISGDGVCDLFGKLERMVVEPKLSIWSSPQDNVVILTAHPFEAKDMLWNGANVIRDDDYESMLASLFHDLLYVYMESLAKQLDRSPKEVRKWADDILYIIWAQSATTFNQKLLARAGHAVCRLFGGIYHRIAKWFSLGVIIAVLFGIIGCSGCLTPDWKLEEVQGGEAIQETIDGGK